MKKTHKRLLAAVFAVSVSLSAGFCAFAQVEPPWPQQEKGQASERRAAGRGERGAENKEELKEMLETMRVWEMTKALELTGEQSLRFFPKLQELDKVKEGFNRQKVQIVTELQELTQAEQPDVQKIKEKLSALNKAEENARVKEAKIRDEAAGVLSVIQQAKFLVFQKEFEKKIRQMIMEVKGLQKQSNKNKREGVRAK